MRGHRESLTSGTGLEQHGDSSTKTRVSKKRGAKAKHFRVNPLSWLRWKRFWEQLPESARQQVAGLMKLLGASTPKSP